MSGRSIIDVDFPLQQGEKEPNLFANNDATDIDEDSDEAPPHHRRVQKLSLKLRQSSARSHLVSETRITVQDLYDFLRKQPGEIRAKVRYLWEHDRFTCHPSKQENCGIRFGAPKIAKLLYHKWFRNVKIRGRTDKSFLGQINGVLIYLTAACIYHALGVWGAWAFVQPAGFSALAAQSWTTWHQLPVVVQKKLVEDTKKRIKVLLHECGFVQEHESLAPLEDPDAQSTSPYRFLGMRKAK
ncbi:hypothetical protein HOY80DRAFT_1030084 [Tuber brumale]|nr:hypothetical protein HOY80DRAFT_1030084 [Tuber brumale]